MAFKNQKGFSPLPVIFLVVTVGILAAGGYFVYKTVVKGKVELTGINKLSSLSNISKIASDITKPKVSENDFSFISDPIIRKHSAAQANISTYRTVSTSSGLGDGTVTNEIDMSNNSFKMRIIQEENGKEIQHTINIDDTNYVKDYKDNSWWKQTSKPSPSAKDEPKDYLSFKPEDIKQEFEKEQITYKSLGQENCGKSAPNLTCYKYEQGIGEAKMTIWFDTKNYLLRRQLGGFGEFSSEMFFYYEGINIKAPTPTKDVPEGKSIYEMTTSSEGKALPSSQKMEQINKEIESYINSYDSNSEPIEETYPEDY